MNSNKATVIANQVFGGISVIDIDFYNESGQRYNRATKRFIDTLNALPGLNKDKIKSMVVRQYGISLDNITFL